jgi:hypothetical protein
MQDYYEVENATYPLADEHPIASQVIKPPLSPYVHPDNADLEYLHILIYQASHRVRLTYHLYEYLARAFKSPGCKPQQQSVLSQLHQCCIDEFHAVSRQIGVAFSKTRGWTSLNLLEQFPKNASDKDTTIVRDLGTSAPRTALVCVDRPRLLIIP